ncbi:MAG TPA: intradiol ring-cleavage dioxygenase [Bosea sp. (in: a-proteobacteria)]|jgi:protocatechuate 3,4-dioxygenase beta subunit|uniref:dioxygenase family protein n=1 Tax=Bosea sp. (in: a-proteobacteria) TaxID=1871050 RepID=UPI002DDCBBA4|nr:intradiol ring-cleavage dioxygenase [Bosea sp. (in: a-proteobacteria)]HEV2552485.1 intradiol ring-cleavage dioxygenase [Bosea sp. (in: a-proteobacteria)]
MTPPSSQLTRRHLTARLSAFGFASLTLPGLAEAQALPATPACEAPASGTRRQTEGPYFTPSSPLKRDLRGDGPGETLVLSGFVLTRQCQPLPGALVDLWHADTQGQYDNAGYRFRGHQLSDAQGRYQFITRIPGFYPGRTRHFHVKVQAGSRPLLTTQLYFPEERAANQRDRIFHDSLLMQVTAAAGGQIGRFDFVLAD